MSGFLSFCLFSGKSGFFRLALLFGKPFLFDTTYTFRFVPQKDTFYVPWNGNDTELARLLECIENNKAIILDGKMPLLVDGYCNSLGGEAENLATAKIRANRVKSELITRAEIK